MLTTVLQAAQSASAAQGGSSMSMWIMLILIFFVMWFFMIRPQRKQQKELEAMRNALKKGDKVVTAGGIYGTVADVNDNSVLIKVDGEVKLRVDKSSIQKDMTAPENQPVKADKKADKTEDQK